jgi:DNA polymerase-3 subunit delta
MATAKAKPQQDARDFFKEVRKIQEPGPCYLLFGEEAFLLDLALVELIKVILPRGINDFNFDQFYGKEVVGDRVVSACETLALMGGRRLVLIRDFASTPTPQLQALADYLEDPSPSTTLLCHGLTVQKALAKTTNFWKAAKKVGVVQEFAALREWEVGTFLQRQAGKRGLTLDAEAEDTLVKSVGTDLASLDAALEKVDLYLGPQERSVTGAVLQEVIAVTRTREIWDLTDAIGRRDLRATLELLHVMLEQGQSAIGINSMVARHFRQLWQVKLATQKGLGKNEIATSVGMAPFFVERYQKAAKGFGEETLRSILAVMLRTDRSLKSSRLPDRVMLEKMVMDVCLPG